MSSTKLNQKTFIFEFPIVHKIVRDLKVVNETVGVIVVEGTCTQNTNVPVTAPLDHQYNVDIDFCKWNGTDIKPVLEYTGMIDDIIDAAYERVVKIYRGGMNSVRDLVNVFAENLKTA